MQLCYASPVLQVFGWRNVKKDIKVYKDSNFFFSKRLLKPLDRYIKQTRLAL